MSEATAITGTKGVASTSVPPTPSPEADRALVREVSVAVKTLNRAQYAGEGRVITFSIDRVTRLPVVRVIDVNTKEVLNQWPAQYVLQLAAGTRRTHEIQDESLL